MEPTVVAFYGLIYMEVGKEGSPFDGVSERNIQFGILADQVPDTRMV